jgi:hypothetical protein
LVKRVRAPAERAARLEEREALVGVGELLEHEETREAGDAHDRAFVDL